MTATRTMPVAHMTIITRRIIAHCSPDSFDAVIRAPIHICMMIDVDIQITNKTTQSSLVFRSLCEVQFHHHTIIVRLAQQLISVGISG